MSLTQQPFASLLEDMVDQLEWQRMERLDKRPQYHDEAACDFCGRPFKAYGSQTKCRRRDCIHALESPEQRSERARVQELEELVFLQEQEAEADKTGQLLVTAYNPVWKQTTNRVSKIASIRLDKPGKTLGGVGHGGEDGEADLHGVVVAATPRHLVEWSDPTFDKAEPGIEIWLAMRRLRGRVSPAGFGQADPGPDQLLTGWSAGRRFANRKPIVPASVNSTRFSARRAVYNPTPPAVTP